MSHSGWEYAFYRAVSGECPAEDFLRNPKLPKEPRQELLKTIEAVVAVGPLQYPASTPRWKVMRKSKKKGEVNLGGIFEARDKHRQVLYRLFCVLDHEHLQHPTVVLLGGTHKPVRTIVSQQIYKQIDEYRHEYLLSRRVAES